MKLSVFSRVVLLFLLIGCKTTSPPISQVIINGHPVTVELAVTQEERRRGLSYRDSLPADYGMLFIYPNSAIRSYWMNEMRFPIDIIWIRENRVVGIVHSASTTSPPQRFQSPEPVNYVLEVNAGWANAHSITTGAHVVFR
ncbi:MAG: DUF192 domain-containing protein [bacterium]|nr:DUF192 domain-containing protein [bacterium]